MSVSSRSSLLEMSTSQRLTEFNTHEDDGDEDSFVFPSTYAALADSTPGEWDSLSFRLKSRALLPPDLSSCFQFMAMGFFIDMFLVLVTIAGFERLSADANVSYARAAWAVFVPVAVTQALIPWWLLKRTTYRCRVVGAAAVAAAGSLMLALAHSSETAHAGIVLTQAAAGVAAATALALSAFNNATVSVWFCAGTGIARAAVPFVYAGINSLCGAAGDPPNGRWHALGRGCYSYPGTPPHSPSHTALLVILLTLIAGWCFTYSFLSVPFHVTESWVPRSAWDKFRDIFIRYGRTAADPFNALNSNPAELPLDVTAQPTELQFSRQLVVARYCCMLVWPVFVCYLSSFALMYGIMPTMGKLPIRDSVPLAEHRLYYLAAFMTAEGVARCSLSIIDLCSRRAVQSGRVMVHRTSLATPIVLGCCAGLGLLSYYRHSADFYAVIFLLAFTGAVTGFTALVTIHWLARFGTRPQHDMNDSAFISIIRNDRFGENIAEQEFLLGLLPSFLSTAALCGVAIGLPILHSLREHCVHMFPTTFNTMCHDRPQ